MKTIARRFKKNLFPVAFVFLLALPASTNYKLKDFGFGTGGSGNSTSGNYAMEAITGEASEDQLTGISYKVGPGLIFLGQANVPAAPAFTNPSNYYNKLKIVLDESGNPSDTKFAIAISMDNFAGDTRFVQSDNTVGLTLGTEDYQTYANWGGASGEYIIGLTANTEYKVKVKAMQGDFSETGYGPVATASTVNPTLSFDIDISATDSETDPPFAINMGDLIASTIVSGSQKIWVDFSTNGESGGRVYVIGQNEGLLSATTGHKIKIDTDTGNLNSLSEGFGAQGSTATGGLTITTLYNQGGNTVGKTDQYVREIFTSANPVSGGRGSFFLKAKSSSVTPSAGDYAETLTVIVSGGF